MGCLESCFKKEEGEPDERSPLLQDGSNPNGNSMPVNTPTIHQDQTPAASISRSVPDEQSMLNGILSKYSSDVIDVTAIDSRIDAVEYMNRVTLYNRKLTALAARLEVPKPTLRSACDNPVATLGAPPPKFDDIMLITELSDSMAAAMANVRVTKRDDLTIDLAQR